MKIRINVFVELESCDHNLIPIIASEITQDIFRTIRTDPHVVNLSVSLYETELDDNKEKHLESHLLSYEERKIDND